MAPHRAPFLGGSPGANQLVVGDHVDKKKKIEKRLTGALFIFQLLSLLFFFESTSLEDTIMSSTIETVQPVIQLKGAAEVLPSYIFPPECYFSSSC